MSKYTFKYEFPEDKTVLIKEIEADTGSDVVRAFYYFLLGSSFSSSTVLSSMQNIVNEYTPEEEWENLSHE